MILVDTSVWVDHLRSGVPLLTNLVASDSKVLLLIGRGNLMGRGIGDVDAHLLTAAKLSRCGLWTQNRRLALRAPCQNRIPSLQLGKPWPQFKSVLRTEPGLGRVALPIQVATSAEKACKLFKP